MAKDKNTDLPIEEADDKKVITMIVDAKFMDKFGKEHKIGDEIEVTLDRVENLVSRKIAHLKD